MNEARLYGHERTTASGEPARSSSCSISQVYGLPPDPVVTTRDLPGMWGRAALAAVGLAVGAIGAFVGVRR